MGSRFLGVTAAILVSVFAQAQQKADSLDIQELEEVVVSDSRFKLNRSFSGKTIISIGPDDLERYRGVAVPVLLNQFSGIEIGGSRSRQGEVLGVYARGGRGRQVLVLLDGVRISDPSSFSQEYDLRLLSTLDIESIEVIKGAASSLYGTNAVSAVINIITRKGSSERLSGEFLSRVGTNQSAMEQNYQLGSFTHSARASGTIHKLTYAVGITHDYADGLSSLSTETNEEDPFSRAVSQVRLGYEFNAGLSMQVYAQESRLRNDYDESFGLIDAPYRFVSRQQRAGIMADYRYKVGSLHFNSAYTEYDSENFSAFPSVFKGDNLIADLYNRYTFGEHLYTVIGLNYSKDRTFLANRAEFTQADPYLNLVFVSQNGFNLNTGTRLNIHSEYGNHWVYSLNPSYVYRMGKGYLKGFSSYSTSFLTPSLTQLFGEFGANPELEPETNRTFEIGAEVALAGKFRGSLLYFDRKEENAVVFNNSTFRFFNADATIDVSGVEVEGKWAYSDNLEINANYTFTERKGDNAIRIPRHKLNLSLGYELNPRLYASFSYTFTGEREDTDFNTFTDVSLDRFSLYGLYISYRLIPNRLKMFFEGENLGNAQFEEVFGFNTRGRNLAFGFQLSL
ncbi:TonB-dependent receptor plug domain-containing protein [Lentiprolixibacter aurantiacus]|uniref:TonB-dependent receptor plug domain-containing protein n=1 Tax=Lentiprolixibacter aurantiacus TaxID=2993939 RepID=A0AAE3MNQ0_9FLAO|nr:TonB-dependent receptor plug domain-containing protein [Lentiprolixibacter aurantiacus]MCX2720217.1 TonB-dependent receptor plug domain-containing protein [Lentiprolixibacter aurantiacus]